MGAKRKKCDNKIAVDKLSNLPDEVLGRILSFLPAEQAVQTSLLSKRWVGLFSLATSLDFDFSFSSLSGESFVNLVDTVLKQHKVAITRFKLSLDDDVGSNVNAWITDALSMGAQELDIAVRHQVDETTFDELFNSCKVVKLALSSYIQDRMILKAPTSVHLPSLSILKLTGIEFLDGDSVSRFFSGCPSLMDLTLRDCQWLGGEVYTISSATLRTLTICSWHKYYTKMPNIELDLPSMVYFEYRGTPQESYHIENSNALSIAKLDVSTNSRTSHLMIGLMKEVANVKVLLLLGHSLKTISCIKRCELPTFSNLSRLEVGTQSGEKQKGWRIIPQLLICSPALETLVFKEGFDTCYDELVSLLEEQKTPFSTNPFSIQVDDYRGSKEEYRMMKLLMKCRSLKVKQVIVNWSHV